MQTRDVDPDDTLQEPLLDNDLPLADDGVAPANVRLELKALSLLSAPVIVQLTALYAISVVNQYFIGHQGAAPLAAAAIGNTVSALRNLALVATCCFRIIQRHNFSGGTCRAVTYSQRKSICLIQYRCAHDRHPDRNPTRTACVPAVV